MIKYNRRNKPTQSQVATPLTPTPLQNITGHPRRGKPFSWKKFGMRAGFAVLLLGGLALWRQHTIKNMKFKMEKITHVSDEQKFLRLSPDKSGKAITSVDTFDLDMHTNCHVPDPQHSNNESLFKMKFGENKITLSEKKDHARHGWAAWPFVALTDVLGFGQHNIEIEASKSQIDKFKKNLEEHPQYIEPQYMKITHTPQEIQELTQKSVENRVVTLPVLTNPKWIVN